MSVETGMTAFVTSLTTALSVDNLFGAVAPAAALIAVCVLFGLGMYVLRKNLRKVSKGKGGTV